MKGQIVSSVRQTYINTEKQTRSGTNKDFSYVSESDGTYCSLSRLVTMALTLSYAMLVSDINKSFLKAWPFFQKYIARCIISRYPFFLLLSLDGHISLTASWPLYIEMSLKNLRSYSIMGQGEGDDNTKQKRTGHVGQLEDRPRQAF